MAMEQLANFSNEVTEGRGSVRAEEECVERAGWVVHCSVVLMQSDSSLEVLQL